MAISLPSVSGDRVSIRFVIIVVLTLALMIPLLLVGGVASERQAYYQQVVADISQSFGHEQRIVGPILVIPAYDRVTELDVNGLTRVASVATQHLVLPDELQIDVDLQHQYRSRAIYDVPVYVAQTRIAGRLPELDIQAIEAQHERVLWEQAFLAIGISDTRAIKSNAPFELGEQQFVLTPGTGLDWLPGGVRVPLGKGLAVAQAPDNSVASTLDGWQLTPNNGSVPYAGQTFTAAFTIAGSARFAMVPLGNQSTLQVASSWPHPKFEGNFLPLEHSIDGGGFSARWSVSALARGVPQSFSARAESLGFVHSSAAVSLYEPVTQYTTVDRGLKYGVLFIALTFLAVLCFELLTQARLHPVQYGVVGLALVLFYLVLLSLSEHVHFLGAYLAATGVMVVLLGSYARSVTCSTRLGLAFAALQAALYWVLYVLLKLEDYALLTGTTALVVGLCALMFVTRSLNRPGPEKSAVL
ncbi:MAG: cell envelope integrity protein CreD [Pseudomonadales bacterium]